MGSLSVQPPSGLTRNLTEVFNFLRNNSRHHSHLQVGFLDGGSDDDKVCLISSGETRDVAVSFSAGDDDSARTPPSWVNVLDEVNYEITRIKTRQTCLKDLQQKHLAGLNFNDETRSPEQDRIKELTDEMTTMFSHTRRLIRLLEEAETTISKSFSRLRENVVASLMLTLNGHLHAFRASQSNYLKQLDRRASSVDNFFDAKTSASSSSFIGGKTAMSLFDDLGGFSSSYPEDTSTAGTGNEPDEELTIVQIQQIMQNEHMTKEREKEVVKISKSILELNTLFKDISALILDQGTILDRIDYNVERSAHQIKAATRSVGKAQSYQKRNHKMQLILVLAGVALFLMLLILFTKL